MHLAAPARKPRPQRGPALRLHLRLAGEGQQRRWQAELLGAPPGGPRHFASLPDLIRWLAQLEWQTASTPGLK
ncbi:MAG: hypothetical protein IPM99_00580 [Rubrivivax sp.]|jgi:hypothetical protein|nr:hypothetical protein [Rubrivivax sp.]